MKFIRFDWMAPIFRGRDSIGRGLGCLNEDNAVQKRDRDVLLLGRNKRC